MKAVFGIVLAALSMFGFAHQAKVVPSPRAAAVAVTFPKAPVLLTVAPLAHPVATTVSKSATSFVQASPSATAGAVLGTSTELTGYVTQEELAAQLQQATNALRSIIYQNISAPNSAMGTGGFTNEIAASNKIDQLSGTKLFNVTVSGVSGLTSSDIPSLSYLPLSGGTLTGDVSLTNAFATNFTATNATTTSLAVTGTGYFAGNVGIGTTSPFTNLSVVGNGYFSGQLMLGTTATSSTASNGTLSWDGTNFYAKTGTATTTTSGWYRTSDNDIDVFLIAGQSNAVGAGNAALSPTTVPGTVFQYFENTNPINDGTIPGAGTISVGNDPVGNAGAYGLCPSYSGGTYSASSCGGSAWPAFGIAYNKATGHKVLLVPTAVGATGQSALADNGYGNWDASSTPNITVGRDRAWYYVSVNVLNNALAAARASGYNPVLKGVLWDQGENDAGVLGSETAPAYKAAIEAMIARYRSTYGTTVPFYILRTGTLVSDPGETNSNYAAVRQAQMEVGAEPYNKAVFLNAVDFPARGMQITPENGIVNSTHYTQAGYNEMGTIAAENVVSSGAYNFFQNTASTTPVSMLGLPTSVYFTAGNVGIGTANPSTPLSVVGTSGNATTYFGSNSTGFGNSIAYSSGTRVFPYDFESASGYNSLLRAVNTAVIFGFDRTDGTVASPVAVSDGEELMRLYVSGMNPNGTNSAHLAMSAYVDGAPSGTTVSQSVYLNDTKLVIRSSGNVGIGTTSPKELTHMEGNNSNQINLRIQNDNGSFQGSNGNYVALGQGGTSGFSIPSFANAALLETTGNGGLVLDAYGPGGGPIIFQTNRVTQVTLTHAGLFGIGTTTPWRTLSVTGTVGFDGLTGAFGAGSLCLTSNKEVVYNSGSDSCLSSLRATKHNIQPLNLAAIDMVKSLQPVSFIYNNDASSTVRYGFIAEDTAAVDSHLGTYDQSGNLSGVDDRSMLAIVVEALQSLMQTVAGFADNFVSAHITVTTGDFDQINARKANIHELCLDDVCVTKAQLAAVLAGANQSGAAGSTSPPGSGSNATTTPDTTPPTITINGANPAHIHVGDAYADLGATVTDNVDQNLGLKYFLNGALVSNIVINTSAAATDTIDYVATDNNGNTATSTRTVIIEVATSTSQ